MKPDLTRTYRSIRVTRNPVCHPYLLGRTVKAVMDGILNYELHCIEMFNPFILQGEAAYGDSFLKNLNKVSRTFRNADYRLIQIQHIRPSRNLNDLAIEALREAPDEIRMPGAPGRLIKEVMTSSPFGSESSMSTPLSLRSFVQVAG